MISIWCFFLLSAKPYPSNSQVLKLVMTFNILFNTVIYFIVILVVISSIKVYRFTTKLQMENKIKYITLEHHLQKQKKKALITKEREMMATDLEKLLFYRFFKISKELIDAQKLLLKSF